MRLVELTLVLLVAPGLFPSSDAIRARINRGELVKGVHWFQRKPRGRIHLDLDAVNDLLREEAKPSKPNRIKLARGGWVA